MVHRSQALAPASRLLLVGAVVATPLFLGLWALQAFTREGFRPAFHPMSLLALGEGGWVQIANFVLTGLLVIGGAIGLARVLDAGRLTRWATALIALMGVGLMIAGIFVTDAGAGFPAGTPEGAPEMSWHGAVHQVGFVVTQLAFVAAAVLLAVRFGRARRRGWLAGCVAAVVVAVALPALGGADTLALRLVLSAAIELGWVSILALAALRGRVR